METPLQILIVEDEPLMVAEIEESLLKAGYQVCGQATSYETALKAMKQTQPDLVLVDIKLDGPADGITTVKELMRIKWVPVIYLTGNADKETLNRAKSTFPAAFLYKPFRMRELSAQIDLAMHNFYAGTIAGAPDLPDHTFLPIGSGYIRVVKAEIQYLKADRGNSELYLTTAGYYRIYPDKPYRAIIISLNLGKLIPYLSTGFYQLSRSIVINLAYLDRIESNRLYIGSQEIPIPDGARKPLIDRLQVVRTR
ncbi:response regulator [Spirosoma spitsbergense]|jgi:DNA-binding response OmpR family regulator|uniref:response regulator n=1 Tax=Spirosoma spitsbergense TaxID=431554 RepID=UPI000364198D|nr:response regulator [Spirosoma spitsbergense]